MPGWLERMVAQRKHTTLHALTEKEDEGEREREREREFVRLALAMCPEYGVTIYVKSYEFRQSARFGVLVAV